MKILAAVMAVFVGLLGVVFLAGNQGELSRIIVGAVLLLAAASFVAIPVLKPRVEQRNIVQRIEMPGDVSLESMQCKSCGGALSKDAVEIKAGAVFISCPYCEAAYQLEEAPKW